jgi:hypothetical protein
MLHPGNSDQNYIIIGTPNRSNDSNSQICLQTNFMPMDLQYAYILSHPHDYLPHSSFLTPEMKPLLPDYYLPDSHLMFPQTMTPSAATVTNTQNSNPPDSATLQ